MKIVFLFIFLFYLLSYCSRGQDKETSHQDLSSFDSLLSLGEIKKAKKLLESDSISGLRTDGNLLQVNRDSVKAPYFDILFQLDQSVLDSVSILSEVEQILHNSKNRYEETDAGRLANAAYNKLKHYYDKRDTKAIYEFYTIANYLRKKYIIREKHRLVENAYRLNYLLEESKQQIDTIKQKQGINGGIEYLDEATLLWKAWSTENRQTPAFRSIAEELEPRYRAFETELALQQSERRYEERTEFKKINYTIGVGTGAFYSISEEFPPYTLSDVKGNPDNTTYPVREDENNIKNSGGFWGYLIAINASYYIYDNLSIELDFSYGKIERQRLRVYPFFGDSFYIPEYASPVTYTTIGFVTNYLLRIKTGFRIFSGVGANLTTSFAPESRSYIDSRYPYSLYQFSSSPIRYSKSIRVILRTGMEFIPSSNSFLSYSFIVDGSLRLTSSKNMSPLFLQSYFRISFFL